MLGLLTCHNRDESAPDSIAIVLKASLGVGYRLISRHFGGSQNECRHEKGEEIDRWEDEDWFFLEFSFHRELKEFYRFENHWTILLLHPSFCLGQVGIFFLPFLRQSLSLVLLGVNRGPCGFIAFICLLCLNLLLISEAELVDLDPYKHVKPTKGAY